MIHQMDQDVSNGRILLAEDEEAISDLLFTLLEGEGYEVTAATTGLDALSIFQRALRPFDLLLTDCHMPGMDGIELARACSRHAPDVAILYMSGAHPVEELRADLATGRRDFVPKPFSGPDLLRRIRHLLAPRFDRSLVDVPGVTYRS